MAKQSLFKFIAQLLPPRPRRAVAVRILICRRGQLGDVLMTTPIVRALRCTLPEAQIAYLVAQTSAAAIVTNPDVDELLIEQPRLFARLRLLASVARFRPDVVLILEANPLARLAAWLSRAPVRCSLEGGASSGLDTCTIPWGDPRHLSLLFFDVMRAAGLEPPAGLPLREVYQPSPASAEAALRLLGTTEQPFVALAPGSGKAKAMNQDIDRRQYLWPIDRYTHIALELLAKGYGLVLLGSPAERPEVEAVSKALPTGSSVFCEPTTWDQAAALLARSRALLATDGGLCHLAASVGCRVVALFGPWDDLPGHPLGDDHIILRSLVPCSPCFCPPWWTNPPVAHCDCLDQISEAQVLSALMSILEEGG